MEAGQSLLLTLNAGGSSLKAKLYSLGELTLTLESSARLDGIGRRVSRLRLDDVGVSVGSVIDHARAAEVLLDRLLPGAGTAASHLLAIGHRIVHGGVQFVGPVRITTDVARQLDALSELAPLHNPPALTVVRAAAARYPRVPAYAVFDTAFFFSLPPHAREYALPAEWRYGRGIRRFGFHGLAHEYLARHARQLPGSVRRLVTLQLGHGCSAAAILDGKPVDTSMGFSPLEGLIMATRPGDVDAGVLLELGRRGESWSTIGHVLHRSGLKGLSGASGDVRELLELEAHGHEGAALCAGGVPSPHTGRRRVRRGSRRPRRDRDRRRHRRERAGGTSANLPRPRVALAWSSTPANDDACAMSRITTARSGVAVDVVPVDEELLIAERVRDALPVAAHADDSTARSAS
jgi:acetate kinase